MSPNDLAEPTVSTGDSGEAFSRQLRLGTSTDHRSAEHSQTMTALVKGELSIDGFIAMQAQIALVYEALETAADELADDAVAGPFIDERLRRVPSLRRDLELLCGPEVLLVEPTDATRNYCERIKSVASEWPAGLVAHHYTRYLGDLSGGQHICRVVERTYGIDSNSGSSFFHFAEIENVDDFKAEYRQKLDRIPLSKEERQAFIDEVSTSYKLSTELFLSLD